MKPFWLLLTLCVCLASSDAMAATRPIRDAGPTEVPDRTPQSDAVFDTLFAHRGERVTDVIFLHGFAPGASRDISKDQLGRVRVGGYLIGATDPERFDGRRNTRNMSQMNNISLGIARANFVNAMTGYRSTVLPQVIFNDRRGVYQVFTEPLVRPTVPIAARDTIIMRERFPIDRVERKARVEFRPTAGYSYTHINGVDYAAPTAGAQLMIRARKDTWIGAYYADGYTFAGGYGDRRRIGGIIFRDGDRGVIARIGGTGAWTINGSSGLARDRAVGMDIGLGYDFGPIMATVSAGVYQSSSVTQRDPETAGTVGLLVDIAPRIRL